MTSTDPIRMAATHEHVPAHTLFQRRADEAPHLTAIEAAGAAISYGELRERVERLACHLRRRGVERDVPVALALEPSIDAIVAILAVLEAGGACLPLDLSQPPARVRLILEDASPPVALAHAAAAHRLASVSATVVLPDDPLPPATPVGDAARPAPDDLAYVLYTSGSTGTPKGVAMPHRGLANLLEWQLRRFAVPQARTLQYAPLGFDVSFQEILSTLAAGGTLVLLPDAGRRELARLGAFLDDAAVERLFITPVALRQVAETCRAAGRYPRRLREVIVAGEQLRITAALRAFFAALPGAVLDNQYGPTETHVVTAHTLPGPPSSWPALPPIGTPIAGTRIYLLGPDLQLVPDGETGEICVAGLGVARGYLNRPELTDERFLDDAFDGDPPERLYRTGDLGRLRPDGSLEFLGRMDDQVKVRGYRVELGEVEAALVRHPAVADAAVALKPLGRDGEKRLVGYVVPSAGRDVPSDELRRFLGDLLPDYMLPAAFVRIDRVPISRNGKTDRAALPLPPRRHATRAGQKPRTAIEDDLAALWADALGFDSIGIDDDLFAVGADSLLAMRVLARVRDTYGVDLSLQTVFDAPTVRALARAAEGTARAPRAWPLRRVSRNFLPLSFAQQRLWFLDQVYRGTSVFNVSTRYRLSGALDQDALRRALDELRRRHEILRTHFDIRDGTPVQVVEAATSFPLDLLDLRDIEVERRRDAAERAAAAYARKPFDLARGPLVRATLIRRAPLEHALIVSMHHAVCDGWSQELFLEELVDLYGASRAGRDPELPAPGLQYGDFAAWQRRYAEAGGVDGDIAYWRRKLESAPAVLELPSDRPRSPVARRVGATEELEVPAPLVARLRDLGRGEQTTLFVVLFAGFCALLHRYTRAVDVVVGSPFANRTRRETERMLGLFANLLPLRADLSGDPPFLELVRRLRRVALEAYEHQDAPFERLVEALNPERTLSHHPLFQIAFAYQHAPPRRRELEGLTIVAEDVHGGGAQFDLLLLLDETEGGARAVAEYDADLFDAATIRRLLANLRTLLDGAAAAPERPVSRLPLLSAVERRRVVDEWNATAAPYPHDATVHGLFERCADRVPDDVAIVFRDGSLTYRELDERANRLARHLRELGVGADELVAVCLDRSPELIVTLLGILKAGGAYVPLEPTYPPERMAFMLEDAGARVLVTTSELAGAVPAGRARVVRLDADAIGAKRPQRLRSEVGARNLAYVMYTSGSTGRPKGVAIQHRSIARLVFAQDYLPFGPERTFMHLAPTAFDASTLEIWGPLLHGGRCVVYGATVPTAAELGAAIREAGVDTTWLTASLFNAIVDEDVTVLQPLRWLLIGGEALSVPHVLRALAALPMTHIVNGYGPTESTTFTSCFRIPRGREFPTSIPIGGPVANTQMYVLDGTLEPVPIGVAGEIYIGGAGLACGYHGRPDLTAERFVPSPFQAGERVYRSGDLGRWLPDGTIDFLGRADDQVKVRGFRIELGEIESVLGGHPGVARAVVVLGEERPGDKRLAAYFVPAAAEGPTPEELRSFLAKRLPDYMIPRVFVPLERMPLSPNGKIDRAALPAPAWQRDADGPFVAPRDERERALAAIWSEVLGVERIGLYDDFFALGGHSLSAMQVVARIRAALGVEPPLEAIFNGRTLGAVARAVAACEAPPTVAATEITALPRGV